METPEPQQGIRNALQSYDTKPDVQAVFMFTRGHLVLTVDCVVREEEQRRPSLLAYASSGGRRLGFPTFRRCKPRQDLEKVEAKSGVEDRWQAANLDIYTTNNHGEEKKGFRP